MRTIVRLTAITLVVTLLSVAIQPSARTATLRVALVVLATLAGASLITVMRRSVPDPPMVTTPPRRWRRRRRSITPRGPVAIESLAVALRAGTSDHPHARRGARLQLVAALRAADDQDQLLPLELPTTTAGWEVLLDEIEAR